MSGDPVKAALKGAAADIAAAAGPAEQAELFGLPVSDPEGKVEAARSVGLKGGRPPGAQNLATRQLREYLLKRGVLPQQAMMEWMLLGVEGIKEALGCDKIEAFDRWLSLADKLGRYFMAPMVPVDGEGKPAPSFTVVIGGRTGVAAPDGAQLPPWEYLQIQELSSTDDGEPKPETANP